MRQWTKKNADADLRTPQQFSEKKRGELYSCFEIIRQNIAYFLIMNGDYAHWSV